MGRIDDYSTGRNDMTEFSLGSVAENVIRHTNGAVLVVPSK